MRPSQLRNLPRSEYIELRDTFLDHWGYERESRGEESDELADMIQKAEDDEVVIGAPV